MSSVCFRFVSSICSLWRIEVAVRFLIRRNMQVAEVIDRINLTLIGVNFLINRVDICIAPPLGDMRLSSCRTILI